MHHSDAVNVHAVRILLFLTTNDGDRATGLCVPPDMAADNDVDCNTNTRTHTHTSMWGGDPTIREIVLCGLNTVFGVVVVACVTRSCKDLRADKYFSGLELARPEKTVYNRINSFY